MIQWCLVHYSVMSRVCDAGGWYNGVCCSDVWCMIQWCLVYDQWCLVYDTVVSDTQVNFGAHPSLAKGTASWIILSHWQLPGGYKKTSLYHTVCGTNLTVSRTKNHGIIHHTSRCHTPLGAPNTTVWRTKLPTHRSTSHHTWRVSYTHHRTIHQTSLYHTPGITVSYTRQLCIRYQTINWRWYDLCMSVESCRDVRWMVRRCLVYGCLLHGTVMSCMMQSCLVNGTAMQWCSACVQWCVPWCLVHDTVVFGVWYRDVWCMIPWSLVSHTVLPYFNFFRCVVRYPIMMRFILFEEHDSRGMLCCLTAGVWCMIQLCPVYGTIQWCMVFSQWCLVYGTVIFGVWYSLVGSSYVHIAQQRGVVWLLRSREIRPSARSVCTTA